MTRVSKRFSPRVRANGEIQPHDCAELRCVQDVQPRGEATLDSTQLRLRYFASPRNGGEGKPSRQAGVEQFYTHLGEQAAAAAGSAGGVRLGHQRMVTPSAYRAITGTATIPP